MMFKKLLLAGLMAGVISQAAYAGNFYIGPSVMLNYLSADHSNYHALSPRVSLGYGGIVTDNFYLAGELTATPGSIDLKNDYTKGTNENTKITHTYGLSIIPGIKVTDTTMVYGRIGAVESYFNSQNKTAAGAQVGLGVQMSIAPSWDLRGEYIYTGYRSVSSSVGSPKSNAIGVGLIHNFN